MSISMSAATQPVLFLDAEWRPLRIDSWQDAITDFFLGKVEVVEYSRDRMIAGVGRSFSFRRRAIPRPVGQGAPVAAARCGTYVPQIASVR